MSEKKYYYVPFRATTGGSVRVRATSKADALRAAQEDDDSRVDVAAQIEDQLSDTKPCEMDIEFVSKEIEIDDDQEPWPWEPEEEPE